MLINQRSRLSPSLHVQYVNNSSFKVDFHNLSIYPKKYAMGTWNKLQYFVSKYDIMGVINKLLSNSLTPSVTSVGTSNVFEGEVKRTIATTKIVK